MPIRDEITSYLQSPESAGQSNVAVARYLNTTEASVRRARQALAGTNGTPNGVAPAPALAPDESALLLNQILQAKADEDAAGDAVRTAKAVLKACVQRLPEYDEMVDARAAFRDARKRAVDAIKAVSEQHPLFDRPA